MITPQQCRSARAWLNISQQQLAAASGVSHSSIKDFEGEKRTPIANNLSAIELVLVKKGIRFIDDNGEKGIAGPCHSNGELPEQ